MEYRKLGNTDITVSRLCFGSLTISPLQANLPIEEGADVIREAFLRGVNFIDTAELYKNYDYIEKAISGLRENIVISTKCYAYSKEGAKSSLYKALNELNTDYIDIFSLHEQESKHTIEGHWEAIEYFIKAKEEGLIRAIGISTHYVEAVLASLKYPEIEVIHPIYNKNGLGIVDGDVYSMKSAIEKAHYSGKGIYSMKPIGGGNLICDITCCFDFVLDNQNIDSIAVGMQSKDEIIFNCNAFERKEIDEKLKEKLSKKKRRLLIDFWCIGCGECVKACSQSALSITDGKAVVDSSKCILCGYCSSYCKDFCIKIV